MQYVFNFVDNYRVTPPHFSGDEMGKNLLLYVGRHGTCLKIVYLCLLNHMYIFVKSVIIYHCVL
jgi:hypothetical protein